jgi:hypothetical protein
MLIRDLLAGRTRVGGGGIAVVLISARWTGDNPIRAEWAWAEYVKLSVKDKWGIPIHSAEWDVQLLDHNLTAIRARLKMVDRMLREL